MYERSLLQVWRKGFIIHFLHESEDVNVALRVPDLGVVKQNRLPMKTGCVHQAWACLYSPSKTPCGQGTLLTTFRPPLSSFEGFTACESKCSNENASNLAQNLIDLAALESSAWPLNSWTFKRRCDPSEWPHFSIHLRAYSGCHAK